MRFDCLPAPRDRKFEISLSSELNRFPSNGRYFRHDALYSGRRGRCMRHC